MTTGHLDDGTKSLARTLVLGVFAVAGGVLLIASPARAAGTIRPWSDTTVFGDAVSGSAMTSVANEYRMARQDRHRGGSVKAELIRRSAAEGIYYDDAYLDYLKLERKGNVPIKAVEVVVPRDYRANRVELTNGVNRDADGKLRWFSSVAMDGEISGSEIAYPDGPGFVYWDPAGSGNYLLKTVAGEQFSTWYKEKMVGESDPNNNYQSYKRKAISRTYDIPNRFDWWIYNSDIKAYPNGYWATKAKAWVDWSPGVGGHVGNCDPNPVTVSVQYAAVGTSLSFVDCDHYTVYLNSGQPGDMSVSWDEKGPGTYETAFAYIIAIDPGYAILTIYDYQKIVFWDYWVNHTLLTCAATNNGKNC